MTCVNPVQLEGLQVPCGKCVACRIHRTREWATRLIHELGSHEAACFLTLTYSPGNLPPGLSKAALQLFFKRLRKDLEPRKIKYFACGEYGDIGGRPHYHAIVFGIGVGDPYFKIVGRSGKSLKLEVPAWKLGFVVGGSVTFESARYVAGYVQKKLSGAARIIYGGLQPPFQLQSQGLGLKWMESNKDYLIRNLGLTVNGVKTSLPRYYRKKLGESITEEMLSERASKREADLHQFLIESGYDPIKDRRSYMRELNRVKEMEIGQRVDRWKPREQ